MEYRVFGEEYIIRMDKGDKIIESFLGLMAKENIKFGHFNGLGATDDIIVAILKTENKEYVSKNYKGDFEIGSLFGILNTKDGEPYVHAHVVIGNVDENKTYAGHLVEATISATAEFVLKKTNGVVDRRFDENVGLNVLKFIDG